MPKRISMTDEEFDRFSLKFRKTRDGCWLWESAKDTRGFGVFRFRGKQVQAHRLAYEHFVGKIKEGKLLPQTCGKRACVNPLHQQPSSMKEVLVRAGVIGRTHCKRGHEFTVENTKFNRRGVRMCRQCIWDSKGIVWRDRSRCKYGHPLTPDNLYLQVRFSIRTGKRLQYRRCRTCMRQYQLARYHQHKRLAE